MFNIEEEGINRAPWRTPPPPKVSIDGAPKIQPGPTPGAPAVVPTPKFGKKKLKMAFWGIGVSRGVHKSHHLP